MRLARQCPDEERVGPLVLRDDLDAVVESLLASGIPRSGHSQRTGEPSNPSSAAILVPKSVIRGDIGGF